MMPNVVRGDRMSGLLSYLVGPGRHNEHTEPHLVAGDAVLTMWHDDNQLDREAGLRVARFLEQPSKQLGVEVKGGHVWHASLSLRAEEGALTDEKWREIAEDFVAAMEFDDVQGTKAPCRWVAVRHGLSQNGNDHIHIAVNLVREDGTKASTHRDFGRAQTAVRALEVKHGLEQLESLSADRSTRGWKQAERESEARRRAQSRHERANARTGGKGPAWEHLPAVERKGLIEAEARASQPRHDLARTVRGCATASHDEGEFVRRMRGAGVLVRPRYADGRTDVVTGYSVAARPVAGERPIWYGGGSLGRDLALPRLRAEWPDTPQGAGEAAAEWGAAKRSRRVVAPGREVATPDPQMWQRYAKEVDQLREQLSAVPLHDRDTWSRVARRTAGAFAAWSGAVEPTPGVLAHASDALARSAQTFRREQTPSKPGLVAVSGAAMLVASAARGGTGAVGQAALLRSLMNLSKAVHDVAAASHQHRQAASIAAQMRGRLHEVHARLEASGQKELAAAAAVPTSTPATPLDPAAQAVLDRVRVSQGRRATEATSPLPAPLPQRTPQTIRPGAVRGPEREGRGD